MTALSRLDAAKEGLKRQIDPDLNVLQDLAMHQFERWPFGFPAWKHGLRIVETARNAVLIRELARFKRLVVDSTALFQHRIQATLLAVGQIDAVFVGLAHTLSIAQVNVNSKYVRLWAKAAEAARFIPGVNALGFHA